MARMYAGHLPPVTVHLETPSVARVFDYYLGGSNNWAVDREFGRRVLDQFPIMRHIALIHREFLGRVVRHLAARGVSQFLDVGSGVPGNDATHDVADAFARRRGSQLHARVIYVDHDPVAVAHAEMLLGESGDPRRHVVIEADLRDPKNLWQQVNDTELLDFGKPIALLMIGVLHLQQLDIHDNEIGPESVHKLQKFLRPGSYVAISHVTDDGVSLDVAKALAGLKELYNACGSGNVIWRSRADIRAILPNLSMLEPGWTPATEWHSENADPDANRVRFLPSSGRAVWAGVGKVH